MGWVQDEIIKYVQTTIDGIKDKLKYDRTLMGKVKTLRASNADVEINGNTVTCRLKAGISIAVGDVVIIKVPNNNGNLKYIDGKLI